jgi:hypothetical protein
MHIEQLPNELLLQIFFSCSSMKDTLNLAASNSHFHRVFSGSKKLPILFTAAETQYGPLDDAIQVVTHNASQPAHLTRRAPQSFALLRQLISIGRSAQKWTQIYPMQKWKEDYENRRLLTHDEAYRVRRAIYRISLYARAFHNPRYSRMSRMQRHIILERAELLHNWTMAELAEIEDIREIIREVVQSHICPSNGTIQRKFRKRFPESDHQLLFNIHLNYPPSATSFQTHFHSVHQATASPKAASAMKFAATAWHEPGAEGWGDDIPHYYVVEDMLKLDPGQILWLRENAPLKGMVESYVRGLGDWFENNGETFGQTLEWVMGERGDELEEFKAGIKERSLGVVLN